MYEELKKEVYKANIQLVKYNLVILTWGNVSGITKDRKYMIIKPSGVPYEKLKWQDMVIVEIKTGNTINSKLKPSSDTDTHIEIYKNFNEVSSIVHTHSINATSFAQAGVPIKAYGTTHADYFYGDVFCTRELTKKEVETNYELNTGKVIVETYKKNKISIVDVPAILVKNHGVFAFGLDAKKAVENAYVIENIAEMNIKTLLLNNKSNMKKYVLDKHYYRKHGKNATYGQNILK